MKTFTHHIINSIQSLFGRFHQVGVAACALGLLVATGTSALAQSSGKTRPHHGYYEAIATPTEWGQTYVAEGISTHLGKCTSSGYNIYLSLGPDGILHGAGMQTAVAANGDTTVTTYDWTLDVFAPMEDWVINSTWKIVGGTGRFKNATGEGTGVTHFNAAGNAVVVFEGVIKY